MAKKNRRNVKKYKPTISKIEVEFGKFLITHNIEIESQFKLFYKFFDFKIKDKNLLIEFDGDYWHKNPATEGHYPATSIQRENMRNDIKKRILAESNGYKLLRIWEHDFRNKKQEVIELVLKFVNGQIR